MKLFPNKIKTENLAVIQREKITNYNYSINRYEQNRNNNNYDSDYYKKSKIKK